MPSKKKTKKTSSHLKNRPAHVRQLTHQAFLPLVVLILVIWFIYRSLFQFPVWFDEIIGKAVFFGLPVWLYITITGFRPIIDSVRLDKLKPGLLRGIAFGGIFGFLTLFLRLLQNNGAFELAPLYLMNEFWWQLLLALLTAFWETIFFFSFIMIVVQDLFADWSQLKQVVLVALIFLLFHIPNTFLRFNMTQTLPVLFLMALFAIGQSYLFSQKNNAFTLIMTHTIWGMCLLIYF